MQLDGRTLSHETNETIRMMSVKRVHEGERPSAVMKSYGLCRTTIYRWLRTERKGGKSALKARKGAGRKAKLSEKQKIKVRQWINGKDPRQYGFDFGLWTRKIIAELIQERMGISLGVTAVGRLLAEAGITPQKPLRRAYERDPEAIEKWQKTTYKKLKSRAKRRGAKIFFLDEAGVRSDQVLGRTWGIKGQTPEVPTSGKRQSINAISAVNERGEFWWESYSGRFNATMFLEILGRFMKHRKSPIMLIVDGHPSHKAKSVAKYIQSLRGRLEMHFLPGYAPELNPDEFVWNHLKKEGVSKKPLKKNESLKSRVESDLQNIQSRPELVRQFFRAPSVAYIWD